MLDILTRGIARAAGVEVPADVSIVEAPVSRRPFIKRLVDAYRLRQIRRSTYRTLERLDDRLLRDIGLHRGNLHSVADTLGKRRVDKGAAPVPPSNSAANDNDPAPRRAWG